MKKIKFWLFISLIMFPTLVFAVPEMPDNFAIKNDGSMLIVEWDVNEDDDGYDTTDGYYIYYWKTSVESIKWRVDLTDETLTTHTIKGLESKTEYTVQIYAYSGSGSSVSVYDELSATTNDIDVNIDITGVDEITVSIDADGSDIKSFSVMVGTTSGGSDVFGASPVSVDEDESQIITGLTRSSTYYIKVTLSDGTVAYNDIFSFEDTHTFLSENRDSEDGCFISGTGKTTFSVFTCLLLLIAVGCVSISTGKKKKILPFLLLLILFSSTDTIAEEDIDYKNIFGIKGGWFEATESEQRDVYEKIYPFSIFYERMFNKYLSADIDLGYSQSDGAALASTGSTAIVTELEIYPSAISVNLNYDFTSFVTGYFGLGGDWWLIEEKSAIGVFEKDVGGWHAKTGVKIFSDELETFKQLGCLFEASYTQLDKFGTNDCDFGGWKFNVGLMYCM